ncbi:uncharacterized protein LOC121369065 [Gigantopelta aegis]|uniref:uncharacterized protein LOC121369065 n=1 Tax=Gigantopelta aegis TaxID=1735272 RepID=UPI001B889BA9|nr:uncharacterized protein LOC121369065 [Gigantopelta aegis]
MCTRTTHRTMDTFLSTVCYTISYILAVMTAVTAECPQTALKQAQLCTASLGIGPPQTSQPSAFVAMGKVETAKKACRERELHKAVDCLQVISDKCTGNTEREHILRMMVDVQNTRRSVEYFCNHLPVYEAHAECIAEQHHQQELCARNVKKNFETKVKATSNVDVMMTSTCRFFRAAVTCSEKILKCKCGEAAADIVVNMLNGFQPPKCLEMEADPNYKVAEIDATTTGCGAAGSMQTISETSVFVFLCILLQCVLFINLDLDFDLNIQFNR